MEILGRIIAEFTPGAVGIWLVVGMLGVYLSREYRLMRGMTPEDRLARRDGFQKQVELLLTENRSLRDEMHGMNENHEKYRQLCHQENDQLRGMLRSNADEIEGLKRKISTLSNEIAVLKAA